MAQAPITPFTQIERHIGTAFDDGYAMASENALRLHKLTASDQIGALGRSIDAMVETAKKCPGVDHSGDGYGDVPSLIERMRKQIAALESLTAATVIPHSKAA